MRQWSCNSDDAAVQIILINRFYYADYTVQFDG